MLQTAGKQQGEQHCMAAAMVCHGRGLAACSALPADGAPGAMVTGTPRARAAATGMFS